MVEMRLHLRRLGQNLQCHQVVRAWGAVEWAGHARAAAGCACGCWHACACGRVLVRDDDMFSGWRREGVAGPSQPAAGASSGAAPQRVPSPTPERDVRRHQRLDEPRVRNGRLLLLQCLQASIAGGALAPGRQQPRHAHPYADKLLGLLQGTWCVCARACVQACVRGGSHGSDSVWNRGSIRCRGAAVQVPVLMLASWPVQQLLVARKHASGPGGLAL